ncbi:phosphoribosylformylglycinamidine synthase [Spiroplasma tabanidicola]|uniref:Phosphoribosylformylglycinamidine synthase n=1 Tax=Spiroplasma tabanidicola TaxID=324079 RepID=A0A6I6C9K1_9MOLU|nr:phosphoribosylformylglycinamidine synthase [Spiroplasma tabanidicola]QGS52266.1 phosphoribosylformylglycinamidine synthase [Spiroplasma tabanidicola]
MNNRIFISKKTEFDVESNNLKNEIQSSLNLSLDFLKVYNVYDIFDVKKEEKEIIVNNVLAEINTDEYLEEIDLNNKKYFCVKIFDSQYNTREESASECVNLLLFKKVKIKHFKLYVLDKSVGEDELVNIKSYLINPIEAFEINLDYDYLQNNNNSSNQYEVKEIDIANNLIKDLYEQLSLAMSFEDFEFCINYFKESLKRNPTEAEVFLIDTYWSDHCRHKTFETIINNINFDKNISEENKNKINEAINFYKEISTKKNMTLMNIATSYVKHVIKNNICKDIEVSEEINAASIFIDLKDTKCLVQFKNETHNHPTEIEPFGGASTCLGGAIRDPLSGRAYVYQGLRVTGAGNILENIKDTLPNKLPQSKISKVAAEGFSSYGNQIGMATTLVKEIYHEGYKAKRLEIGAVVGVTKLENLVRQKPEAGDIIVLVGGATGKDGIGGATGSSKNLDKNSMKNSYSEVQKGNPVEERKLQRLFSKPIVSKLIKKANDLGAGGIGVGAGELANGVSLTLDDVHLKYVGLTGKEILISESQERMVVVIKKESVQLFIEEANKENLYAVKIGEVTDKNKFEVTYNKNKIVDLDRDFINSGGITNQIDVMFATDYLQDLSFENKNELKKEFLENYFSNLNIMSQKEMIEMFDFSIGSTTVLAPYGGLNQLSESQVSCQKIPIKENENICTLMSYGYNPYLFEKNIFIGSMLAVIESVTKIIAAGGSKEKIKLTFQEYFERLNKDNVKWGKPLLALLGSLIAQKELNTPAIGGKDSMSGTYESLNVPPTLVSFALTTAKTCDIVSTDFKNENNHIYLLKHELINNYPDYKKLNDNYIFYESLIKEKKVLSAFAIQQGGILEALVKMSLGNGLGFDVNTDLNILEPIYGSIIFESKEEIKNKNLVSLGKTNKILKINGIELDRNIILKNYLKPIEKIYPNSLKEYPIPIEIKQKVENKNFYSDNVDKVKVLLAIFPGTNCEYDIKKAFKRNNVECEEFIFKNLNNEKLNESINILADKIKDSHIFVIPGGFSLGDEPDGSGKYIANVIRNKKIKNALSEFLKQKKLILGICNGFQALIKAGILIDSETHNLSESDPSLIKNDINRHIAKYVNCKVVNTTSPWTQDLKFNQINNIPVSHGEGRFAVNEKKYKELVENNQIAFEYINKENNPNGSYYNIEGIVSKCGLVLGKMGHSERFGTDICKNIYGDKNQDIFSSAINYFLKNNKGDK